MQHTRNLLIGCFHAATKVQGSTSLSKGLHLDRNKSAFEFTKREIGRVKNGKTVRKKN
jgi:hypothetical protein